MKKRILWVFVIISHFAIGQTFPGAEGFGSQWTFTDNYEVRIVTSLNNSGTGSLRDAITNSSTYDGVIIVFNGLSGIIEQSSTINFPNTHQIYIAGQTSENGIVLHGTDFNGSFYRFDGSENGIIVRGIFFDRDGSPWANDIGNGDCIAIGSTSNTVYPENIIFDHCVFTAGTDENVQFWQTSKNITMQNCIIAEPIGDGSSTSHLGHIVGADPTYDGVDGLTLYNNAFITCKSRTPSWHKSGSRAELVNNIIYNALADGSLFYENGSGNPQKQFNFINNHYIDGPETNTFFHNRPAIKVGVDTKFYAKGNLGFTRPTQSDPEWDIFRVASTNNPAPTSQQSLTVWDYPLKNEPISATTQDLVDSQYNVVGTFARIDKEVAFLDDIANGTGTYKYDTNGAATPKYVYSAASISSGTIITDSDGDGIPNSEDATWVNDTFGYVNSLASSGTDTSTGSVNANAGSDVSICSGESTTLTASGGTTYTWSTGANTASINVSPSSTQTYTVTVSDNNGNSDTDDVIVTVNTVTANAGTDITIDEGSSTTLTASGGNTYLWSTGATTASITVSPSATTNYAVTATTNGCDATDTVQVTVNPPASTVTANAGSDVSICSGESTTLTASGGTTYTWSTGETTASINVSPSSTQTYTVTATDGSGNSDSDDVIVTVNSVTANAGIDITIDEGNSTTLTANGGDTYVWSTGATTANITVSPNTTTIYTVTATTNGCDDTDTVQVTVNPSTDTVTANAGSDVSICLGENTTLTASGGTSYTWSTGATTASITVSPESTQTYTVTVSDGSGNSDSDDVIVTVNSVTANAGADLTIDEGSSTTLTASGGDTYVWSTGATTASITISPNTTTNYTVTATSNGCDATDTVQVTVNPLTSTVTANAGSDVSICSGESTTLTASGGTSYSWNTGATTQSITVSPNTTQTFTVTATDTNGISDTDDVIVTVITVTANAGVDQSINEGDGATLKAIGGDSYLWSNGATTQSITVSPIATKTFTVTVTKNGCDDSDSLQVTVIPNDVTNPPPANANAGENFTICLGETANLIAFGGTTYVWSTGEEEKNIQVSPTRTTTYTLTAIRGGVTDIDTVTITVENCSDSLVSENNTNSNMIVYPNPSNGNIHIKIDKVSKDSNILINDSKGSLIYYEELNSDVDKFSREIDLSRFSDGIYFVRLLSKDQNLIKKLIII